MSSSTAEITQPQEPLNTRQLSSEKHSGLINMRL